MVAGNLISGRLSDKYMPGRVAAIAQGMICVALPTRLLLGTNILVKCLADVSVYGGIIRRLKPPTSIIDPLLQRWRDAGSRQRTSCVQFRKCYRSLLWWVTPLEVGLGYKYPALIGSDSLLSDSCY